MASNGPDLSQTDRPGTRPAQQALSLQSQACFFKDELLPAATDTFVASRGGPAPAVWPGWKDFPGHITWPRQDSSVGGVGAQSL